ncbi:MAG: adenosylcobinamide-GDP ribazoletransferase [Thermoleophilia bacterium]|nr:adenosylcobinamide-GDP ribazoletransferase [Thermoleophilia bacterium]
MKAARRLFGFFTVLPLSSSGSVEDVARAGFLLPLVAVLLGGIEGLVGWGSGWLLGQPVAAAAMLATALLLTGLHHTDGLADLGDALMVHGDSARRIQVLKDRTMGVGAVSAMLITSLISWAALLQLLALRGTGSELVWLLMAGEISARLGMLMVIAAGRPSHDGTGRIFLEEMKGWRIAAGILLSIASLALVAIFIPMAGVLAAAVAAAATGLFLAAAGRHWLGGCGGDVLGAAVELGRMAALLALVAVLIHTG